jgi:hypothetical protein
MSGEDGFLFFHGLCRRPSTSTNICRHIHEKEKKETVIKRMRSYLAPCLLLNSSWRQDLILFFLHLHPSGQQKKDSRMMER